MRSYFFLPFLALAACGTPVDVRNDASPSSDASSQCDPHRAPCRVTLTCDGVSSCEGVHLATGAVASFEGSPPEALDVTADLARFLGLSARSNFCRFGMSAGTGTSEFPTLRDVPVDPASCSFEMGNILLCGVRAASYVPSCSGDGLLVRDGATQLYRLRVIDDRNVGALWQVEFEWMAID